MPELSLPILPEPGEPRAPTLRPWLPPPSPARARERVLLPLIASGLERLQESDERARRGLVEHLNLLSAARGGLPSWESYRSSLGHTVGLRLNLLEAAVLAPEPPLAPMRAQPGLEQLAGLLGALSVGQVSLEDGEYLRAGEWRLPIRYVRDGQVYDQAAWLQLRHALQTGEARAFRLWPSSALPWLQQDSESLRAQRSRPASPAGQDPLASREDAERGGPAGAAPSRGAGRGDRSA